MYTTQSNKKYLLVSDMDGTLLNSNHLISVENQQAILAFQDSGGCFSFATGRALCSVIRFAGPLSARYGILCNGSIVYDFLKNSIVSLYPLPKQAKNFADEILSEQLEVGLQIYSDFGVFTLQYNEVIGMKGVPEENSGLLTPLKLLPDLWCKMIMTGKPEKMQELKKHINDHYPQLKAMRSGRHFCEITNVEANKGKALQEVCKLYGIPLEKTVAVGDSENDLPMLKVASLALAVENAMDSVIELADYTIPNHNKHPMIRAVELAKEHFEMT